ALKFRSPCGQAQGHDAGRNKCRFYDHALLRHLQGITDLLAEKRILAIRKNADQGSAGVDAESLSHGADTMNGANKIAAPEEFGGSVSARGQDDAVGFDGQCAFAVRDLYAGDAIRSVAVATAPGFDVELRNPGVRDQQPAGFDELGKQRDHQRPLGVILAAQIAAAAPDTVERVAGNRDGRRQPLMESVKVDWVLPHFLKSVAESVRADGDHPVFQRMHVQERAEHIILMKEVVVIELNAEVLPAALKVLPPESLRLESDGIV